jgi:hypothetical protein
MASVACLRKTLQVDYRRRAQFIGSRVGVAYWTGHGAVSLKHSQVMADGPVVEVEKRGELVGVRRTSRQFL